LWAQIGIALDGDIAVLIETGLLVWMPAHQTTSAIGCKELSNGDNLTVADWRANRLVDALAKQAATGRRAPMAITRLLASSRRAVEHAAALLGQVTHAANNFVVEEVLPDGVRVVRTIRDAQQQTGQRRRARCCKATKAPELPADIPSQQPQLASELLTRDVKRKACQALSVHAARRAKAARMAQAMESERAAANAQRLVIEASSRSRAAVGRPSAEERLLAVLSRVRSREAARKASDRSPC